MRSAAVLALLIGCGAGSDGVVGAPTSGAAPSASSAPVSLATGAPTSSAPDRSGEAPAPSASASSGPVLVGDAILKSASGKDMLVSAGEALPPGPVPIIVAMHGMCETGKGICELLAPVLDRRAVAVCPTGNGECTNKDIPKGTNDWILGTSVTTIRDALDTVEARLGQVDDRSRGDVLLGNSRGAFAAISIVSNLIDGPWTGLVLVSASVEPDPAKLKRAGIQRVLFATEDFDVTAENMRKAHARVCKAGLPSRYVSLGKMGHGIHPEGALVLRDNMDWVMGRVPATECL